MATVLVQKDQVSLNYPGLTLLKDATLKVIAKRRYGLVAPNGAGKSTLLAHLARDDTLNVCYVAQEAPATESSALETVLASDRQRSRLLAELAQWTALEEDDERGAEAAVETRRIFQALAQCGEQTAIARAARILAGLQFTPAMQQQTTATFSGGWRMRIALAGALFAQPQLLLLDEPTNHLDLHARIWLAWYLQHMWRETLVVVSHDRAFLNEIATDIIHLHTQQLFYYRGNYDAFQQTKAIQEKTQSKACKKQTKATVAQAMNAKARKKQKATRTAAVGKIARPYRVRFAFAPPAYKLPRPVLAIHDISFGFGDNAGPTMMVLRHLDAYLDMQSRVAIVGANGVGKSTLLKVIAGDPGYEPTAGRIERHRKLKLASFGQHLDTLRPEETPIAYLRRSSSGGTTVPLGVFEARGWLGSMGLPGKAHVKSIAQLSGGQKCRVVLALLARTGAHMLLLDEPSNHLDMESVEALVEALAAYKGGIVLISHNAYLIERITDTLWILPGDGRVEIDTMSLKDYRQALIQHMGDATD